MNRDLHDRPWDDEDDTYSATENGVFTRREFVGLLGAGLLITAGSPIALAQRRGGSAPVAVGARIHLAEDGTITVFSGKVEIGQGLRSQIGRAAAEELRIDPAQIQVILGDTALTPDDGGTSGSRTTPSTIPAVRSGAAAARELLRDLAAERWQTSREQLEVRDGGVHDPTKNRTLTYAELAKTGDIARRFAANIPRDVTLTPVTAWKVMGRPAMRPNALDLVTGRHQFPSDIRREGMLYGAVLRAPSYGATLESVDLAAAEALPGVVATRDGDFVGCAAPNSFLARQAVEALAQTARWQTTKHPSSTELFDYLKEHARGGASAPAPAGEKQLRATYHIPYIQHAPMEPRTAVAEWEGDRLTVWTATQAPFGVRGELARAFDLPTESVRVIMPDSGGGFGGRHNGDAAIEAARIARKAGRPVSLRWTREEEFTWAAFRPAGVIELAAGLNAGGRVVAWQQININSGGSAVDAPYAFENASARSVSSEPPLRQASYRALAATANNFAREAFVDELAAAAGTDPLDFRLAHLREPRLRAVLERAAARFGWKKRRAAPEPNVGIGLACGTEKGSVVAACAEVAVDRAKGTYEVRRVTEVFECGAIQNPANLLSQVQGCMIMGLGGAIMEEIYFEGGKILNAAFSKYRVPHFTDVPELDIELLDRPDLPSVGGGETPIIAIAPAIANALFAVTGQPLHKLPLKLEGKETA